MPKQPQNSGKKWTSVEERNLKNLISQNTPTRVIGLKLKRTPASIYTKAALMEWSLKPTNQSPYNRRNRKA